MQPALEWLLPDRGDNLAWLARLGAPHVREWRNWQTRWLQVPVLARVWGFKSPLAHHHQTLRESRLHLG